MDLKRIKVLTISLPMLWKKDFKIAKREFRTLGADSMTAEVLRKTRVVSHPSTKSMVFRLE